MDDAAAQRKRVLVVEDDPALNKAIVFKLTKKGYETVLATNAESALALLHGEKKFDFIWLDILLPGMSGLQFLKKVREDVELKDEQVAIVSASGDYGKEKLAKQLGVVDYIVKSQFDLNDIIERVSGEITKS